MSTPYWFVVLQGRSESELDALLASRDVYGVGVTDEELAARCAGIVGDDPTALIEAAKSCSLPPTGVTLATRFRSLSTIGAMAVLALRADRGRLTARISSRIDELAQAVKEDPSPEGVKVLTAAISNPQLSHAQCVDTVRAWLTDPSAPRLEVVPGEPRASGAGSASELRVVRGRTGADRRSATPVGYARDQRVFVLQAPPELLESAIGLALDVAPVVVGYAPAIQDAGPTTYVVAQTSGGRADLDAVRDGLNAVPPSRWTGSTTRMECEASTIPLGWVLDFVLWHMPPPIAVLYPGVARVASMLERVPDATRAALFGGQRWEGVEAVALAIGALGDDVGIGTLTAPGEGHGPTISGLWVAPESRRQEIAVALVLELAADAEARYDQRPGLPVVSAESLRLAKSALAKGAPVEVVLAPAPIPPD